MSRDSEGQWKSINEIAADIIASKTTYEELRFSGTRKMIVPLKLLPRGERYIAGPTENHTEYLDSFSVYSGESRVAVASPLSIYKEHPEIFIPEVVSLDILLVTGVVVSSYFLIETIKCGAVRRHFGVYAESLSVDFCKHVFLDAFGQFSVKDDIVVELSNMGNSTYTFRGIVVLHEYTDLPYKES